MRKGPVRVVRFLFGGASLGWGNLFEGADLRTVDFSLRLCIGELENGPDLPPQTRTVT